MKCSRVITHRHLMVHKPTTALREACSHRAALYYVDGARLLLCRCHANEMKRSGHRVRIRDRRKPRVKLIDDFTLIA